MEFRLLFFVPLSFFLAWLAGFIFFFYFSQFWGTQVETAIPKNTKKFFFLIFFFVYDFSRVTSQTKIASMKIGSRGWKHNEDPVWNQNKLLWMICKRKFWKESISKCEFCERCRAGWREGCFEDIGHMTLGICKPSHFNKRYLAYVYILILTNTSQNFNVCKTEAEKGQYMLSHRRWIEEPPLAVNDTFDHKQIHQ